MEWALVFCQMFDATSLIFGDRGIFKLNLTLALTKLGVLFPHADCNCGYIRSLTLPIIQFEEIIDFWTKNVANFRFCTCRPKYLEHNASFLAMAKKTHRIRLLSSTIDPYYSGCKFKISETLGWNFGIDWYWLCIILLCWVNDHHIKLKANFCLKLRYMGRVG